MDYQGKADLGKMEDLVAAIVEGNTERIHDLLEKWDGDINDR